MNNFKNMQFKIDRKEQCERLQRVLQSLGYDWQHDGYKGNVVFLNSERLFTSDKGTIYTELGSGLKHYKEQDTDLFIASHESKVDETVVAFKGLEEAYNEPLITESPWFDNDGAKPDVGGASVDIMFRDGEICENGHVSVWDWNFHTGESVAEIIKWRFHKPEDAEFYKPPKTQVKVGEAGSVNLMQHKDTPTTVQHGWGDSGIKIYLAPSPDDSIDAHYNFTYHLTQDDVDMGFIKIDPYFVSQQWQLGSKDSTGVIFHLLKTIARFGDKNGKDREINALYKSTIRLAQLEGVELK